MGSKRDGFLELLNRVLSIVLEVVRFARENMNKNRIRVRLGKLAKGICRLPLSLSLSVNPDQIEERVLVIRLMVQNILQLDLSLIYLV